MRELANPLDSIYSADCLRGRLGSCLSALLCICLSGCTETVLRRTTLPIPGSETRGPAAAQAATPIDAEKLAALDERVQLVESRMQLLYRITAARLAYLEALSEYQSTGLNILAKGESGDPEEEARLFSALSAQGQRSRAQAQAARKVMVEAKGTLTPGTALVKEIDAWIAQLDRQEGKSKVPAKPETKTSRANKDNQ